MATAKARAPAFVVFAIFAFAFVRGGFVHAHLNRTAQGFLWAIALFGALLGAGSFIATKLRITRPGVGLASSIGLASFLGVGGVALALGIASRWYLIGTVAVGLGLGIPSLLRWRVRPRRFVVFVGRLRRSPFTSAAFFAGVGLASFDAIVRSLSELLHPLDDTIAYAPLAQDIVARGLSVQPFSFRRTCVLGGQELLHATFLAPDGDIHVLRAVESGVAAMIVLFFALEAGRGHRLRRLIPLVALVALPAVGAQNLGADMTSLVLLLGAFGMLQLHPSDRTRGMVVAVLLASFVALRNSNLAPALATLVLERALASGDWRTRARGAVVPIACFVALLGPWLYGSHRSNGTWLFPLQTGYYQPDFALLKSQTTPYASAIAALHATARHGGLLLLATLATGALLAPAAQRSMLRALVPLAVVLLTIIVRVPDADPEAIARYLHPFLALAWLSAAFAAAHVGLPTRRAAMACAASAAILIALTWKETTDARANLAFLTIHHLRNDKDPESLVDKGGLRPMVVPPEKPKHLVDYGLQTAIPEGETVLVMVDQPVSLDFRRNRILLVDLPGAEAPPPGYPAEMSGPALATALRQAGIRWVLVIATGRSEEAYRIATYVRMDNVPLTPTLERLGTTLAAYQSLPPVARVASNDDLDLFDLSKLPP